MKKMCIVGMMFVTFVAQAQSDQAVKPLTFSGYIETYYTYDFGAPEDHNRPSFVYSFNRHNEVNVNLGFIKAAYQKDRVRANLALAAGSYMNANYAAEPGVLKNIFEANAGIKISKQSDLWIDAGIFASHIGFESAIGKDCWNLTRGILADNSPYYEAGARVGYNSPNGKWYLSALLLNGWQRIQRVDGNNTPAFGHQVTFKPNASITLNSSSFIGNDKPDSVRQMRYFHNFYGIFQLTSRLGLITGFDIGWEQQSKGSNRMNSWYTPVVILKYGATEKLSISARGEYYSDPNQVIVSTASQTGFKTWGLSTNVDYQFRENILWRIEARGFSGEEDTFTKDSRPASNNIFLATSLAVSF
jgi:hypothetical protein